MKRAYEEINIIHTFLEIVEEDFYQLSPELQYTDLTKTDDMGRNALYSLIQHLANCNDAAAKKQLSRKTADLLKHLSKSAQMSYDQQYDIFFPSRSSLSTNWDLLPLIVEQLDHTMQREFLGVILNWHSPEKCKEIYAQFQVEGCPFANHRAAYFLSFLLYGMDSEPYNILLQDTRLALPLRFLIACSMNPSIPIIVLGLMDKMSPAEKMQLFIDSNVLNHFDTIGDDELKKYILQQLNDDPKQCCELFTQPRALGNFLLSNNFLRALDPERIMIILESLRTLSSKQRSQVLRHLKDYIDSVENPDAALNVFYQFITIGVPVLLFPSKSNSPNAELLKDITDYCCLKPQLNQGTGGRSAWKIDLFKEQVELAFWLDEFEDRYHLLADGVEKTAAEQLHQELHRVFCDYLSAPINLSCSDPINEQNRFQSAWHTAINNAPSILSASQGWGEFLLKGLICMTGIGLLLLAGLEIKAKREEEQKDLSLAGISVSVPNKNWFFPHVHFFKSANGKALQALDKQVDKIVAVQNSVSPMGQ